MNREQIIAMAREADLGEPVDHDHWDADLPRLERFAALVAAAEREECAKYVETKWVDTKVIAAAIRARGEKE